MWRSKIGIVANVLDCDIIVSEFELGVELLRLLKINTLAKAMSPQL